MPRPSDGSVTLPPLVAASSHVRRSSSRVGVTPFPFWIPNQSNRSPVECSLALYLLWTTDAPVQLFAQLDKLDWLQSSSSSSSTDVVVAVVEFTEVSERRASSASGYGYVGAMSGTLESYAASVDALDALVREAFANCGTSEAATERLRTLREDKGCWRLCLMHYGASKSAETKFWCLQTLAESLEGLTRRVRDAAAAAESPSRGESLSEEDATALRNAVGMYVSEAVELGNDSAYVKNKLAQVCAQAFALEYPSRWRSFFTDVVGLLNAGTNGVDMFTRVMEAIDEEVIATVEAGRSGKGDFTLSMAIKDAMRADGSVQLIFDAWRQCLTHFARAEPRVASRIWAVARRYVDWVDIGTVASDAYVACAKECLMLNDLDSTSEDLRAASTAYLHAIFTKGMETRVKLSLITTTNIIQVCSELQSICTSRAKEFDEEFVVQVTYLTTTVGTELLNTNKIENITALGPELSAQASALLHTITPVIISSISSDHERAVLAALPFLTAYVSYVKSQPALLASAQPALTTACQALIARGAFPLEEVAEFDWNDGSNALTQEFEADIFNLRAELNVQFRNIARLVPQLAREVVRQVLSSAIPVSIDSQNVRWQNVEVAVSALYTLGEGADDAAVKPMSLAERAQATNGTGDVSDTPLGALAISLIKQWGPNVAHAARHRIVAPIFLETCVRYHSVLERDDEALMLALTAFLDERGIQHTDQTVRARACYLFSRLCRPLRCKLSDRVEDIMRVLPNRLAEAAQSVVPDTRVASQVSAAGVQSKAMADGGNDDRLYLFDASGILLGADDVPETQQRDFLTQIATALVNQIESTMDQSNAIDEAIRVTLATRAIVALGKMSKGFSQRTCLTGRPQTGDVFRSCLEVVLRCLDAWPRDASVRSKVTAFLHRMIEILGPTVTQYLAPAIDKLRHDAGTAELRETLVLFNQLIATYQKLLAPLVIEVLPGLTTQVFETTARAYRQAEAQSQGTDVLLNTEMCREAGELERTWLTTAAALGNNLVSEVFTGVNLDRTAQLREQTLLRLVEATTNHTMVSARKVAIQALRAFVDAWMADSNVTPGVSGDASVPRQDVVPGFTQFVLERICTECCIVPIMRGDLNLSDAVSVTVLNESNAILSIAFARQRKALEAVMTQFFPAILPGIDQARVAQIMTEYARILVTQGGIKSTNSNSKSARALADVLHTELKRAHSGSMPTELQPRLAKRGT